MYLRETEQELSEEIITAVEETGKRIEELTERQLEFSYSRIYGFNIYDESGFSSIYVANFNLVGDCSFYDTWIYDEETENAIVAELEKLVAQLSPDGTAHHR